MENPMADGKPLLLMSGSSFCSELMKLSGLAGVSCWTKSSWVLRLVLFLIAHAWRPLLVCAPSWVEAEEMGLLVLAAPRCCLENLDSLCGCSRGVKKWVTQDALVGKTLQGFHLQLAKWQMLFSWSGALWKPGPAGCLVYQEGILLGQLMVCVEGGGCIQDTCIGLVSLSLHKYHTVLLTVPTVSM